LTFIYFIINILKNLE